MLFNSIDFAVFLPIVFFLYWFVANKNLKVQNLLIACASLIFYGWWDWRFLSLLLFSSIVDFSIGRFLAMQDNRKIRKALLTISVCVNLGFLGFFKYYNFFVDSFVDAFSLFGTTLNLTTLQIILPVGISFYTFQTLSYSIDVYRKQLESTKDFIAFLAFVSFFPQLVAGPIERATHLLPQFYKKRYFDYDLAVNGCKQILWGLFKKMVIADNCAKYADLAFNNVQDYEGSSLFVGAVFFAFQIYGDFSGYSDIAIGTARLFGFDLMQNFAFPYFSRDISEFWRRWHISLNTWFRDYLYIPLGGSRGGNWMKVRNIFIIFLVSGFWHGANWTFIIWGGLNALYFLPLMLAKKNRNNMGVIASDSYFPNLRELTGVCITFLLTVFAWIFFRSNSLGEAMIYINRIFSDAWSFRPIILNGAYAKMTIILLLFFIIVEWLGRFGNFGIDLLFSDSKKWKKLVFFSFILFLIGVYARTGEQSFIYFQF